MNEKKLLDCFASLRTLEPASLKQGDSELKRAILEYGSATEDNLLCIREVEYGVFESSTTNVERGFKLKDSGFSVAEVLNFAEGCSVPSCVQEQFEGITQQDWDVILRLVVLVFSAVEV